ncbi:MAG TPA: LPS assembly protein LptD [Candidatus Binatia bacterium]|nr:LPS assembly protein LptD [Candidatus Binatia bacterium]
MRGLSPFVVLVMACSASTAAADAGGAQPAPSTSSIPVSSWTPSVEQRSEQGDRRDDPRPSDPCAQAFTEPPPPEVDAPEAAQAGAGGGKSPIVIEADKLEVEEKGDKVRAEGNVQVQWESSRLEAGTIDVDQDARKVSATGNVQYDSPDMRATASSAALEVDTEVGTLEDVEVRMRGESGRFGGARAEKLEGRRFRLEDGYFTTCGFDEDSEPDWQLRASSLDVRLDDYARLRGGRFEIKGVPVLYVPYLVLPTKETRQSGFLAPEVGHSSRRGFVLAEPYFWAIDKSQDVTVTGVLETEARVGVDGEYRYRPSRNRFGALQLAYYNEGLRGGGKVCSGNRSRTCRDDSECSFDGNGVCLPREIDSSRFYSSEIPENRWSLDLLHREVGRNWSAYADLHGVSDDLFLRETDSFSDRNENGDLRRSRRYTASRLGVEGRRGFTSGGIQSTAYQTLGTSPPWETGQTAHAAGFGSNDLTLHKPATAWLQSDQGFGPFVFGIDSSLATFMREESTDGQRLDVATSLGLPLLTGGAVVSRAWVAGRASAYHLSDRQELNPLGLPVDPFSGDPIARLDEFPVRGVFEGGIDVRTKLARPYALDSPHWKDLYNSIEPFAGIRYLNTTAEFSELPLFDRLDAIDGRDVATYGIDSRFFLRGRQSDQTAFELARISLLQTYNISREVVDDHFSDIDLAAFVQPIEGLALRTLTSYNVGSNEFRGAYGSLAWDTGPNRILRGPSTRVAAAYRYVREDSGSSDPDDVIPDPDILESGELLARLGLTRNISIGLKGRYDFISTGFVEKAGGITFTSSCDCWSIGLGVIERVNPDEFQVRVAIELAGLGGIGKGAISRTTPALDDVAYEDVGFWRPGW